MSSSSSRGAAIVTGGAVRVGRALCLALADAGYDVAIHYRNSREQADTLATELRQKNVNAASVQADLAIRQDVSGLVSQARDAVGPLSLLVNCASSFEDDQIETFSDGTWDQHMAVHLYAPMKLVQGFVAQTQPGHSSQIINIIDQRVWALTPKFFSYTLSKSALWTATQTLAQALAPRGIRVNAIGPGPTLKNPRQSDTDWQKQNEATILGHGATPDDIAEAMLYLLKADAVTGQMIAVDGGQHLAWQTPDVLVKE